jgi:hypothetical protein
MSKQEVDALARLLWDFLDIREKNLQSAEALLVMGSNDVRIPRYAAKLFLKGLAPIMVMAGREGRLTREMWDRPEAEIFAEEAIKAGVPSDKILVENRSTNTQENIMFSREILAQRGIKPRRLLIAHKPYMQRRTWATFKKIWPEVDIQMTTPPFSYEQYPNDIVSKDTMINLMVGEVQRLLLYPERDFHVFVEVPEKVKSAYEQLIQQQYTTHLIKI